MGRAKHHLYGELPKGWEVKKLKDVSDPRNGVQTGPFGSQLHKADYTLVGTPIITVEHLGANRIIHTDTPLVSDEDKERLSRYSMKEGDIIFSRVGSVDRSALVRKEEDGWLFSGRCLRVRPNKELVDPAFLSYFMSQEIFKEHVRRIAVGATMPSINTEILEEVEVLIPPLPEQRRIAHILGTLDEKIELNRRMNATLEAIARALFKSWFVGFDPVRAKAAGHPTGLPPALDALFPSRFVNSELGEVPEGWRRGRLDEFFDITMGQSPPGDTYNKSGDGLPFFQGTKDFGERFPQERVYCSAPKRIAQQGDTLLSVRAPVGDLNIALKECCIGRGIASVRHKSGSKAFTYYSMDSIQEQLRGFEAEGTVFGAITKEGLNSIVTMVPPEALVSKFEQKAKPVNELLLRNHLEFRTLVDARDSLLPWLLQGGR
jgi:type I restriction enzyme S subunit